MLEVFYGSHQPHGHCRMEAGTALCWDPTDTEHQHVIHREHKGSRAQTSLLRVLYINSLSFHQQSQTDFLSVRTAMEIE